MSAWPGEQRFRGVLPVHGPLPLSLCFACLPLPASPSPLVNLYMRPMQSKPPASKSDFAVVAPGTFDGDAELEAPPRMSHALIPDAGGTGWEVPFCAKRKSWDARLSLQLMWSQRRSH